MDGGRRLDGTKSAFVSNGGVADAYVVFACVDPSKGQALARLDAEVAVLLQPFRDAVEHMSTIPGVGATAASAILAEIGCDMSRFPSANHLVSWACLCPRSDESAGKHRSTRTQRGAGWLKPVLIQVAWAAVRTKDSYERALFHRALGWLHGELQAHVHACR